MLHAGVCVPRQYTAFARIAFGQNTREFFERLTRGRFATAHPCWRGAARIYHVHHKALYRAIGEPDTLLDHLRLLTSTRSLDAYLLVGRDDETPGPLFHAFAGKEIEDPVEQGSAAGSCEAHEQQSVMCAWHVPTFVGKIQILRNEETTGVLSGRPYVSVIMSRKPL